MTLPKADITGMVFDRLTALGYDQKTRLWICLCSCGVQKAIRHGLLVGRRRVRSCGCLQRDTARKRKTTHGGSRTPEYRILHHMIQRCTNQNDQDYPDYGGRGICVCPRWLSSFADFLSDVGPRPSAEHEIDRINNNGHYEPGNVRWVSHQRNCRNRRSSRLLTHDGRTMTLTEWAIAIGISNRTLRSRLEMGWCLGRALTQPPGHSPHKKG
jgi:hypothetical protein